MTSQKLCAPTSNEGGYRLSGLVSKEGDTVQWSPYVWTTILEMRYLGVKYTVKPLTFHQIRHDLAKQFGDEKITVPVVEDGQGGWMKESFDIARHLHEKHAQPGRKSLLLDGEAGVQFCKFLSYWIAVSLAELRMVIQPRVYETLDPASPSATYFIQNRFGDLPSTLSAVARSHSPEFVDAQAALTRRRLKLLDYWLKEQHGQGKQYVGGELSHADFAVYGWYLFSTKFVPELERLVWGHDELQAVRAWVGQMRGLGLVHDGEHPAR